MYGDEGNIAYSLKLQKRCKKQQFRVELLEPVGATESGSQRYRSSGWQVGPVGPALVIDIVDLVLLHDIPGVPLDHKIHDALLPLEHIINLRRDSYMQVTTDADGMIAMQEAIRNGRGLKATRMEGWSRHHRCYYCKVSAYDQSTGALFKCTQCHRAYHQRHHDPIIANSTKAEEFVCQVCSGADPYLCVKCNEPFSEKEVEDRGSLGNNELVHCGNCDQ